MATGDKIYIADKETLDKVHNRTEETHQRLNEAITEIGKLDTSLSLLTSEDNIYNPIDAAAIQKIKYEGRSVSAGVNYAEVFDISQPGILYMAVVANQPSSTTGLQVIVDNTMIVNSTLSPAGSLVVYSGFVSRPIVVGLNANSQILLVNGTVLPTTVTPTIYPIGNVAATSIYSFSPIRWNDRLRIRAYCNGSSTNVYAYYKLD